MNNPVSHDVLGMRLDYVAPDTYLDTIIAEARDGEAGYCCVSNVHQCILVHDDPVFRAQVNGARYVLTDSVILQRARSLRFGVPFQPTLKGADLMLALCERAERAGVPIALVGGQDENVLKILIRRLLKRYPDLKIAYAVSPPFRPLTEAEDAEMTAALVASGAQIVFVGLGCPKQEKWMATHSGRVQAMMLGVGAAFDFNAGIVEPSPAWVHKAGLEWLYRLLKEPKRLWRRYFSTSPRFVWLLTRDALVPAPRAPRLRPHQSDP